MNEGLGLSVVRGMGGGIIMEGYRGRAVGGGLGSPIYQTTGHLVVRLVVVQLVHTRDSQSPRIALALSAVGPKTQS